MVDLLPCELRALETLRANIERAGAVTVQYISGYSDGNRWHREDLVESAYKARDLDLMRVYEKYLSVQSADVLVRLVVSLRVVHGRTVSHLVTKQVAEAYGAVLCALGEVYGRQLRDARDIDENVVRLALDHPDDTGLIVHLISDRGITDLDGIKEGLADLRVGSASSSLVEGVL